MTQKLTRIPFTFPYQNPLNTHPTNPDAALPSEMQLRVLPIVEPTLAAESGTPEMDAAVPVLEHPDVPADDEPLAPRTEAGFLQGPPLLVRVAQLEEAQLAAGSQRQGGQHDDSKIHANGPDGNAVSPLAPGKITPSVSVRAGFTRLIRFPSLASQRNAATSTVGGAFRSRLRAC